MLHNLRSPKTIKKSKIVGRGIGSTKGGHTTGRGTKGQLSRSGYRKPGPAFEGGQNPLSKRLPKRKGFTRGYFKAQAEKYSVKLGRIASTFKSNEEIDVNKLHEAGIIRLKAGKYAEVKVVFDKEIDKKLNFKNLKLSAKAIEAVKKVGGSVE